MKVDIRDYKNHGKNAISEAVTLCFKAGAAW